MKKALLLTVFLPIIGFGQICNPAGNIMLYSNYDGGVLNIDVNVNIPNLKIGVCTYEGVTINLSGAFVNNVTEVFYAGYNANNAHCGSAINTSINGAPGAAATSILFAPTATLANPNGNNSIICAYQCDNLANQGGCNTPDQVEDYFLNQFGGSIYAHYTQYGCWSGTNLLSAGGNCCPIVTNTMSTGANIVPTEWCAGTNQSVSVPFISTGTFTAGNVYTAELSDASGSFAAPLVIGTLPSTANSGTISATVLGSVNNGSGYRIRVNSSAPALVSVDNGADLTVHSLPNVTLGSFSPVCVYDPFFTLIGGAPASGNYSGTGVTANLFDPSAAGIGTTLITYTYVDGNGCENSAQSLIPVDGCASLKEIPQEVVTIYPNPTSTAFTIAMNKKIKHVEITDVSGKQVKSFGEQASYSIEDLPNGTYVVKIFSENEVYSQRLIVQ